MARLMDDIEGHDSVIKQLLVARERERLAQVLLFVGPPGVGKFKTAQALAQVLICEKPLNGEPSNSQACGQCPACLRVAKEQSENLFLVQSKAAEMIKLEQAQEVLRFLQLRGLGRARVVIIDQAQQLNPQAANSLLKALEEPYANTYFILVVPTLAGVLPTIRSRAQVVRFAPLTDAVVKARTGAPDWVVSSARGSLAKAENLASAEWQELRAHAAATLGAALMQKREVFFAQVKKVSGDRAQSLFVVQAWQQLLRDARFVQSGLEPVINQDQMDLLEQLAKRSQTSLDTLGQQALQLERDLSANVDRTLALESFCMAFNAEAL